MSNLVEALKVVRVSDIAPTNYRCVGGCGRVYIELTDIKVSSNSKIKKEVERLGFKMTLRPYRTDYARLYIGYDNATGYEWEKANNIAAILKSNNVNCYVCGDGD